MEFPHPGTYYPNAHGSEPAEGAGHTRQEHKGGPPWICGKKIIRASARDNTGQNTKQGYTLSPRIGIKNPDPAGNRIRYAGLKDRYPTTTPWRRTRLFLPKNNNSALKSLHVRKISSSKRMSANMILI